MKKRWIGSIVLACLLALSAASFAGCGDKQSGTKYYFKDIQFNIGSGGYEDDYGEIDEVLDAMKQQFTGMYISVSSKKITLHQPIMQAKTVYNCTRSGDKYVIDASQLEDWIGVTEDEDVDLSFYGIKTEDGFDLILEGREETEDMNIVYRFIFVRKSLL